MTGFLVTVFSGIGVLIFAYLLFHNASGVVSILNSSATGGSQVIKTLQAR